MPVAPLKRYAVNAIALPIYLVNLPIMAAISPRFIHADNGGKQITDNHPPFAPCFCFWFFLVHVCPASHQRLSASRCHGFCPWWRFGAAPSGLPKPPRPVAHGQRDQPGHRKRQRLGGRSGHGHGQNLCLFGACLAQWPARADFNSHQSPARAALWARFALGDAGACYPQPHGTAQRPRQLPLHLSHAAGADAKPAVPSLGAIGQR